MTSNVKSSSIGGGGSLILDANAVINLRSYPPKYGYITPVAPYDGNPDNQKSMCGEQTNYIGYSYGALLAAQTAMYYAKQGYVIDNLALIGAPIDADFLKAIKSEKNIKNLIVKNLDFAGDTIYAGMSEIELLAAIPKLAIDVFTPGKGHFYYSADDLSGRIRRKQLADELFAAGLR